MTVCKYVAAAGASLAKWEEHTSREAALLAGVGKSTVGNHRSGNCACGPEPEHAAPETPVDKGRCEYGPEGGEFTDVTTSAPLKLASDWDAIFQKFNLDPAEFVIIDDTVRCSTWQQSRRTETGDRDIVQLYAYKARFARRVDAPLPEADVQDALNRIRAYKLPHRIPGSGLGPVVAATLNLADIQGGKSEGGGVKATEQRLLDGLENFQAWVTRQRAGGRNIEELALINNGDPYEGCAGNYDAQLFTVELNHRGQMNFVLDMWTTYARELFPMFQSGQFVSVLCNHTEMGRMGQRKNQTSDSDSGGAFLAETLQRILGGRNDFDHVKFTIPHDEMNVYTDIAGVPVGFNHGHKIPGSDAGGFEKWLNGQVRGDDRAHKARIWVTAHRHNFQCFDLGSATVFQCPSADGGSKWLKDMTGKYSRSGILALLIGEHDPLGWSDPAFL